MLNTRSLLAFCLLSLGCLSAASSGQQAEEVLRVETRLVQTDVMVFDKQGRFVEDLRPEQFQLLIDGKPQEISFFELVRAGTVNEEAQLAAARGEARKSIEGGEARPLDRGRTIIFLIDDAHLAFDSLARVKKMLHAFLDGEMGQNDQALVASASGRLGFLQQFTSQKEVLRAAIDRLSYQLDPVRDAEKPVITEYLALQVERENRDALDYLVGETMRQNGGRFPREMAENMVRGRARRVAQQMNYTTNNTLLTLGRLVRAAASFPGRKNVFFISDGFFVDRQNSDAGDKLRRLTDVAARSGSVIYTMDARGLFSGSPDASSNEGPDLTGGLSRARMGEIAASQEALNQLASDTGGRAILNTNALGTGLRQSLDETSAYYLLAWNPANVEEKAGKYRRLEVKVKGRSDLTIRVQRGFYDADPHSAGTAGKKSEETLVADPAKRVADELRAAIGALVPPRALPTALALNYLHTPEGFVLTVSMRIASEAMSFDQAGVNSVGAVDVRGTVFDAKGQPGANFQNQLTVNFETAKANLFHERGVFYHYQVRLPPGLYQVRVAARDAKTGRAGGAAQWVEIPDLSAKRLTLSSLVLGAVNNAANDSAQAAGGAASPVEASVERRFARGARLRFVLFIYNAARGQDGATQPDLATQVQVFRDNQPVLTAPLSKIALDGAVDLTRVPYAAEMGTTNYPPGRYRLQVTVIDRLAKTSAAQSVDFEIR